MSDKGLGSPGAFVVSANGLNMRKSPVTSATATKTSLDAGRQGDAPVELVCLALALALFTLACRIATIW
jgi:hypothetical protein